MGHPIDSDLLHTFIESHRNSRAPKVILADLQRLLEQEKAANSDLATTSSNPVSPLDSLNDSAEFIAPNQGSPVSSSPISGSQESSSQNQGLSFTQSQENPGVSSPNQRENEENPDSGGSWSEVTSGRVTISLAKLALPKKGKIIISDSQGSRVDTNRLDPSKNTTLMSFKGLTMDRLATRLQSTQQNVSNQVESITLLLGGNDLAQHHNVNRLLADTRRVIEYCNKTFPRAKIFLTDVLPRKDLAPLLPSDVSGKLEESQESLGFKLIKFPTLNRRDFKLDGVHLDFVGINKVCRYVKVSLDLPRFRAPLMSPPPDQPLQYGPLSTQPFRQPLPPPRPQPLVPTLPPIPPQHPQFSRPPNLSPLAREFVPQNSVWNNTSQSGNGQQTAWNSHPLSGNSLSLNRPVLPSQSQPRLGSPMVEQDLLSLALKLVPLIRQCLM